MIVYISFSLKTELSMTDKTTWTVNIWRARFSTLIFVLLTVLFFSECFVVRAAGPHRPNPEAVALCDQADPLIEKNKCQDAKMLLDKAISIDPEYVRLYEERSRVFLRMGERAKSDLDTKKGDQLILDQATPEGQTDTGMGESALRLKEYDLAVAFLTRAISKEPKSASLYSDRGFAYANLGLRDKSKADHNMALKLAPKGSAYYFERGQSEAVLGMYDEAAEDFSKTLELGPKVRPIYEERGKAYLHAGSYYKALNDLNRALAMERKDAPGGDPFNLYYRAQVFIALGETQLALDDLKKVEQMCVANDERAAEMTDVNTYNSDMILAKARIDLKRIDLPPY